MMRTALLGAGLAGILVAASAAGDQSGNGRWIYSEDDGDVRIFAVAVDERVAAIKIVDDEAILDTEVKAKRWLAKIQKHVDNETGNLVLVDERDGKNRVIIRSTDDEDEGSSVLINSGADGEVDIRSGAKGDDDLAIVAILGGDADDVRDFIDEMDDVPSALRESMKDALDL